MNTAGRIPKTAASSFLERRPLIRASSFGFPSGFVIRHASFLFFLGHRRNSKRIESTLRTHHSSHGQRHAHAAVPRRQVTAVGGITGRFPIAAIWTHRELKAVAARGRQAQIYTRPDDTARFGDGFMLVS